MRSRCDLETGASTRRSLNDPKGGLLMMPDADPTRGAPRSRRPLFVCLYKSCTRRHMLVMGQYEWLAGRRL